MAVKFGTKQLSNPTPSKLGRFVMIFTGIAGLVVVWIPTATYIGVNTREVTTSILGLLIAVFNFLKPFFGVQPTEDGQVSVQEVTEMENTTDKKD